MNKTLNPGKDNLAGHSLLIAKANSVDLADVQYILSKLVNGIFATLVKYTKQAKYHILSCAYELHTNMFSPAAIVTTITNWFQAFKAEQLSVCTNISTNAIGKCNQPHYWWFYALTCSLVIIIWNYSAIKLPYGTWTIPHVLIGYNNPDISQLLCF